MNIQSKIVENDRFLRLPELKRITGLSKAQLYLLISRNQFPKQYKLSERASGWLFSDAMKWMDSRVVRPVLTQNKAHTEAQGKS